MSAPLGRIVDRHIKLIRYKTHPLVVSGETIPEPLLYLLEENRNTGSNNNSSRRNQRKRSGPRKTENAENIVTRKSGNVYASPPMAGTTCKSCHSDMIYRIPSGKLRCETCRFEWR
jgi:hypothetical protein